jgi:DNA-binding NarL/FixJ family response regulator
MRGRRKKKKAMDDLGVRASSFVVGGEPFVVLSYAQGGPAFAAELTEAEQAVAAAAMAGRTNAQIAIARGVSERTVANQMAAILRKLGLRSRLDLVVGRPA